MGYASFTIADIAFLDTPSVFENSVMEIPLASR